MELYEPLTKKKYFTSSDIFGHHCISFSIHAKHILIEKSKTLNQLCNMYLYDIVIINIEVYKSRIYNYV